MGGAINSAHPPEDPLVRKLESTVHNKSSLQDKTKKIYSDWLSLLDSGYGLLFSIPTISIS